jgi:hypothetical protein
VRGSYYAYENLDFRFVHALQDLGNGGEAVERNPWFSFLSGSPLFESGRSEGRLQQGVIDLYSTFTPFGERFALTPFFQFTTLLSAESEDHGYAFGLELGDESLLELTVMYARLDRNSTVALFTDSDIFDGRTNARGWFVQLERRLTPFMKLRAAYVDSRQRREQCLGFEEGTLGLTCDLGSTEPLLGAFYKTSLDRERIQLDLLVDF